MNKERILKLADTIEADANNFNLTYFSWPSTDQRGHTCGTPSCVAGWANHLSNKGKKAHKRVSLENETNAARWLGLLDANHHAMDVYKRLFAGVAGSIWAEYADKYGWERDEYGDIEDWSQITGRQAAKVLRDLAYRKVRL